MREALYLSTYTCGEELIAGPKQLARYVFIISMKEDTLITLLMRAFLRLSESNVWCTTVVTVAPCHLRFSLSLVTIDFDPPIP